MRPKSRSKIPMIGRRPRMRNSRVSSAGPFVQDSVRTDCLGVFVAQPPKRDPVLVGKFLEFVNRSSQNAAYVKLNLLVAEAPIDRGRGATK